MTPKAAPEPSPGVRIGVGAGGFTLGMAATLLITAALSTGDTALPAAVATTAASAPANPTVTAWVDPREVIIGSTALIPTAVQIDGTELDVEFELVDLAPRLADESPLSSENPALVFPVEWTLITADGEFSGKTPPSAGARRARFSVPSGLTLDRVQAVRLDAYRVPVPFAFPLELDPGDASFHEVGAGVSARIQQIIEQRDNTLVIVELDAAGSFLSSDVVVNGTGPDWVRASASQLGRPTWTLDFRGRQLPAPLPLRAHGLLWPRIDDGRLVDVSGLGSS